jgi:hypothetical protein
MVCMRAVVPYPVAPDIAVVGSGRSEGTTTDISVEIHPHASPPFTIRTLLRTGTRMGPRGFIHGEMTDAVSMASLAVTGLFLRSIPSGTPRQDAGQLVNTALAKADALARDHNGWSYTPMVLESVTYALRYRLLDQGFVAHADIGDSAIAAWGAGDLPEALGQVQRVFLRTEQ